MKLFLAALAIVSLGFAATADEAKKPEAQPAAKACCKDKASCAKKDCDKGCANKCAKKEAAPAAKK